jgi:hypothetical protein
MADESVKPTKMPGWRGRLLSAGMAILMVGWLVVFIPARFLYGSLLCTLAWFAWMKPDRDIIVAHSGDSSEEWMSRIHPLVDGRAVFLDYDERKSSRQGPLTGWLFYCFGPQPMTGSFMPQYLPAVIVFRKFRRPKTFSFGQLSRERATQFRDLVAQLAHDETGRKQDSN